MAAAAPRIVLGTMAMGGQADGAESKAMADAFVAAGGREVDTAIMYQGGKTHVVLAPIVAATPGLAVATKVNPWHASLAAGTGVVPKHGLSQANVEEQVAKSLADLGVASVDIMYLHAPDHATPIEETLAAIDAAHKAGAFSELGLSNYAAWEVVRIHAICAANGYVLPTVYQGMYNMFTRAVEAELLPALRSLGIRFYAYNITAGGLLTGKHARDALPDSGRFNGSTAWGIAYRQRFWNDVMFDGLDAVTAALDAHYAGPAAPDRPTPYAVAIRFLAFHSALTHNDGLILGASSAAHVVSNAAAIAAGPLPPAIVDAINTAADACAAVCPAYFRGFSGQDLL